MEELSSQTQGGCLTEWGEGWGAALTPPWPHGPCLSCFFPGGKLTTQVSYIGLLSPTKSSLPYCKSRVIFIILFQPREPQGMLEPSLALPAPQRGIRGLVVGIGSSSP